jgi:hypothetical protein
MSIGEIIGDAVRYPLSDPKKLIIVKYQKFYTTCPSKPGKSGFKLVKYKILVGRIDSTSLINYVLNYIFGIILVIATLYSNFITPGAANIPLALILIVIALIDFVFIFGYEIRILRATLTGLYELPEFDDPLDMFVDGLKAVVVGIIYAIPLSVIIGLLFYGLAIAPVGLSNLSIYNSGSMIFIGIFALIVILIALVIYPLTLMSLANMVYNNSKIEAAFKFSEIFNKLSNIGWGNFLV